jgi:hypothetical protein
LNLAGLIPFVEISILFNTQTGGIMNTINRIKKITEANDHIDQAINLILGAVSGFPEEE